LCEYYKNENLIDIIRLFIENGIDVNCKDKDGWNALIYLCRFYKNENLVGIIGLLIENEIDVNCTTNNGNNALTKLCEYYENENLINVIKFLIKSGLNLTEETCAFFKKNYHKKNRDKVLQLLHEILQQHPVGPATKRMKFE
jgi:ankyrin repeat protein